MKRNLLFLIILTGCAGTQTFSGSDKTGNAWKAMMQCTSQDPKTLGSTKCDEQFKDRILKVRLTRVNTFTPESTVLNGEFGTADEAFICILDSKQYPDAQKKYKPGDIVEIRGRLAERLAYSDKGDKAQYLTLNPCDMVSPKP